MIRIVAGIAIGLALAAFIGNARASESDRHWLVIYGPGPSHRLVAWNNAPGGALEVADGGERIALDVCVQTLETITKPLVPWSGELWMDAERGVVDGGAP